ncbi:toxin-antitoxin system, toxin component, RelE family [delta proteobacterium NaphS2]|nr:toxin-antitoxin system, toxin component, RelE family [delta proteobacterium NaphS2]
MNYDVHLTETFQKSIKALKKKYPRVKDDLLDQIEALIEDPFSGDAIPGWNKEIWKARVASSDVKKGKRAGFRVIYYWKADEPKIYLLAAYFKGKKTEIAKKEIESLLKKLNQELG